MTNTEHAINIHHYDADLNAYGRMNGRGPVVPLCMQDVCDGNNDDPSYAYCLCARGHAGDHQYVP